MYDDSKIRITREEYSTIALAIYLLRDYLHGLESGIAVIDSETFRRMRDQVHAAVQALEADS